MASAYKGNSHDLRIVLLGVSGAGKTPAANAILGRDAFEESRSRKSVATAFGGGTLGPVLAAGGSAALSSVARGATLSEALKDGAVAAGQAAVKSVTSGASLPAALMGGSSKK
ncbi:hypothetical protein Q8A67_005245 [Cirrhinus molitorella]|uniref:AIG1-type G domain-containing protein n=1 Tax=Cirrhinus molitorella TaxID=172907 RepID=A0AA88TX91_9TELE|nr:hypothetical protein Q8A67_005245 [Cirrhinus molitorella]